MELLPCPFCGGEATFDHDDNGRNWISCGKCGATTDCRTHTMEDCHRLLAEQWNRRVIPLHGMRGDCRKQFDDWWSEFTSAHEDWRFADSDALRWQAWQAAWNLRASPASAPKGFALVPVVPTHAILDVMFNAGIDRHDGDLAILYRAILAAAPTPPENKAPLEAVAEVVWYDPQLSHFPEKPGKIIDGSIAFMESAEIGTKLFSAPVPSVSEGVDPVMTKEELIAAAESIGMRFPGATIPPVSEDQKDAERLNWLDEQGMIAIGHKGYGEYRYYAGDQFPAIRQVIDQARQEDKP